MELKGSLLRDIVRAPVGRVQDVLLDPDTLNVRWLQVDADGRTVLVPAAAVSEFASGELLVPYTGEMIAAAEHAPGDVLTESDAARLMDHYGFAG